MGRTKKCVAIMAIFGVLWIMSGIIGGIVQRDVQFIAMWGTVGIIGWTVSGIAARMLTRSTGQDDYGSACAPRNRPRDC